MKHRLITQNVIYISTAISSLEHLIRFDVSHAEDTLQGKIVHQKMRNIMKFLEPRLNKISDRNFQAALKSILFTSLEPCDRDFESNLGHGRMSKFFLYSPV